VTDVASIRIDVPLGENRRNPEYLDGFIFATTRHPEET